MEGRLDSLEQRVGAVEGVMSRIEGKLDAVQATLAGQRSVGAAFGRLLNVGVSSSGWVAFLLTWWRGH
jgi:hypothetical protein